MINYWKKNKEYYLAQEYNPVTFFLGNPRNPFKQLHILDYDIYSDDLEGGLEVIDSDSDVTSDEEFDDDIIEKDDRPLRNTNPERIKF